LRVRRNAIAIRFVQYIHYYNDPIAIRQYFAQIPSNTLAAKRPDQRRVGHI
jgi:hypothetical protein